MMGFGKPSLKGQALRHLARREHSRAELERKLSTEASDTPEASAAQQIAAALDELAARGLQSDARTAESMLAGRGQRLGSLRLKQELRAKGLDAELVSATLEQARSTEVERAREVWRRRFGAPAGDAAGRAKQMRFLAARGFGGEVIRQVLKPQADE